MLRTRRILHALGVLLFIAVTIAFVFSKSSRHDFYQFRRSASRVFGEQSRIDFCVSPARDRQQRVELSHCIAGLTNTDRLAGLEQDVRRQAANSGRSPSTHNIPHSRHPPVTTRSGWDMESDSAKDMFWRYTHGTGAGSKTVGQGISLNPLSKRVGWLHTDRKPTLKHREARARKGEP
jgi:hypothetical protein